MPDGGPIKMGYTEYVEQRLKSLQTGHYDTLKILKAISGSIKSERALHKKIKHIRLRGEWFKPAEELLDFIEFVSVKK